MLYILEGNEANFKTTIANKLSDELNLPVIKGSSFELAQCSNVELFRYFLRLSLRNNLIIDRFIYSNLTYASLYDNFAIITKEQKVHLEKILANKARVIYLFADDEVIKERIRVRGDEYVDTSMASKINDKFNQVITDSRINPTWYDTNEWSSDEIVDDLIK